jgi:hypothetical protein
MSTGLIILVAVATAAAVLLVSWALVNLVHVAVDNLADRAPDISRWRELVRQYSIGGRRSVEPPLAAVVPTEENVDSTEVAGAKSDEGDRPADDDRAPYRQVGEEVTAVLTAAEHAAAQIRETTLHEAEQARRAAEEQAAATLADAKARRAEADRYAEETRAAADAYAEETRRRTDEEAARTVSEAEERARLIRAEAEHKAGEIEAEALRRRDALATSVEGMQERVESVLEVFRRATGELEELLPEERRSTEEDDEGLDEALKPVSLYGELRSYTDR